ncbi:MAG: hypothetical protein AAGA55_12760, partial [Planctomycetota bacterium]
DGSALGMWIHVAVAVASVNPWQQSVEGTDTRSHHAMPSPAANSSDFVPAILPDPGRGVRTLTLLVSVLVAVSVLPVLYVTLFAGSATLWFSTLFELTVLAAAVVGVFAGLGRFRDAWALSLACLIGTLVVTSVFTTVEVRANFRDDPSIGRLIMPFAGLRFAFAGIVSVLASYAVWNRDRRSWGLVFRAVLLLLPVAACGAWLATGNIGFLTTPLASPAGEAARIAGILLGGLLGIGLVSAGGHLLIRAFELGRSRVEA